jgi:septal ring factor EnvC (AmiA/AmiB activator)
MLALILVVVMISGSFATVSASTLTDKQAELNGAQAKLASLQSSLDSLAEKCNQAESNLAKTEDDIAAIEKQVKSGQNDMKAARAQLADRVVSIYKSHSSATDQYLEVLFSDSDITNVISRLSQVSKLAEQDKQLFDQVEQQVTASQQRQQKLLAKQKTQKQQMADFTAAQDEMGAKLQASSAQYKQLKQEVATLKAAAAAEAAAAAQQASNSSSNKSNGSNTKGKTTTPKGGTVQPGSFVFPVDGPHSYVDSFGAPRSGGRTHQGCDIMAARGTPVVACVSGTISATSYTTDLGGITIHLRGKNGTVYYHAHLNGIAPGIRAGVSVTAGQLIGYVGNTGNASGGACHLHFEIRPGGGAAIDPYPTLRAADG